MVNHGVDWIEMRRTMSDATFLSKPDNLGPLSKESPRFQGGAFKRSLEFHNFDHVQNICLHYHLPRSYFPQLL